MKNWARIEAFDAVKVDIDTYCQDGRSQLQ